LTEKFDNVLAVVEHIRAQVSPVLTEIQESPMFRMFGGGKRKGAK
jgi:hypothetical protein